MSDSFDPYRQWLGIEPHEQPPDHYRLLGVARFESESSVIQTAAEARMALIREFQTGPRGKYTHELLNKLAAAKLCLLNPDAKEAYDAQLRADAGPRPSPSIGQLPPAVEMLSAACQACGGLPPPVQAFPAPPPMSTSNPPVAPPPIGALPSQHTSPPRTTLPPANHAQTFLALEFELDDDQAPFFSSPAFIAVAGMFMVAGLAAIVLVISQAVSTNNRVPQADAAVPPPVAKVTASDVKPPPDDVPVVIVQEGDGSVNFPPSTAELHGPSVQLISHGGDDYIGTWRSPQDWVRWRFKIVKPGVFRVNVTYATTQQGAGGKYLIVLDDGDHEKSCEMRSGGGWTDFVTDEYFLPVTRGGEHQLAVKPETLADEMLMNLKSIQLVYKSGGNTR